LASSFVLFFYTGQINIRQKFAGVSGLCWAGKPPPAGNATPGQNGVSPDASHNAAWFISGSRPSGLIGIAAIIIYWFAAASIGSPLRLVNSKAIGVSGRPRQSVFTRLFPRARVWASDFFNSGTEAKKMMDPLPRLPMLATGCPVSITALTVLTDIDRRNNVTSGCSMPTGPGMSARGDLTSGPSGARAALLMLLRAASSLNATDITASLFPRHIVFMSLQ
jgi:hypothetical protein